MAQYLYKGSLIGIEGRIQTRNYDNQQGHRVYVTEVVTESVQFLESKNKDSNNAYASQLNSNPYTANGNTYTSQSSSNPYTANGNTYASQLNSNPYTANGNTYASQSSSNPYATNGNGLNSDSGIKDSTGNLDICADDLPF